MTSDGIERRRSVASRVNVTFPSNLPISARTADIAAAIADHQVVVVAGETGSGKSTQLPKICLQLGRGINGLIGHTQPRRIAARAVAERIAEELGTEVGAAVGCTVRFSDRVSDQTLVRVMTDGVLLAEIHRDRNLDRYDTVIVDEAHERSLNIDFLLGYLAQLLPRRPDLRVIITSATIDTERLAAHFADAPVVSVSGRSFPVEVRYRPLALDGLERDQVQAICDAVTELSTEGVGDVLVFLSGEREIRDTAEALRRSDVDILPLYARLSIAEQHRVFQPHSGRRVVLATNVAETSLTVPGIRYVVDAGTARISRYNSRTKVQRLPIEPVSQASANQRAGRCGRVAPGICIRLYAEDDFVARPEFTEPEILRTSLASVLLQMAALGLGEVSSFPFVDAPDARAVRDGVLLLRELGAFGPEEDGPPTLTRLGRRLARLPIDPRYGRMVLAAEDHGCVREVTIIAAGLTIQDPRERPADMAGSWAEMHARFDDERSDFLAYLRLWEYIQEQQDRLSSNQFRRLCRAEFINYLRVREWQDLVAQLHRVGTTGDLIAADPDRIHRALLAGLLSHIGCRDAATREYQGARGARFVIAPGSALATKPPRWVMAAELVETTRMRARVVAAIQPAWIEATAGDLLQRTYGEPVWDAARGAAATTERVTLYGLPIVAGRAVPYERVDPVVAREQFIHHALVERDWRRSPEFLDHNSAVMDTVRALEDRARRDLLVSDDDLWDFYDARVPDDITSARRFDTWWKRASPHALDMTTADAMRADATPVSADDFPDVWRQGQVVLPLSYRFDPGATDDGVAVHIPLAILNQVTDAGFDWHVPGWREDVVAGLLRSLPKHVRRSFVPAAEYARRFLAVADPADGSLIDALQRRLPAMGGERIPPGSWHPEQLPDHLRITFLVHDASGRTVATGKDLDAVKSMLAPQARSAIAQAVAGVERTGERSWVFGSLPSVVQRGEVRGYPAIVDEGETVGVRVFGTPVEQRSAMWAGTRRLLRLTVNVPSLSRLLPQRSQIALARTRRRSAADLLDDCITCALDELVTAHGGPASDEDGFTALRDAVAAAVVETAVGITLESIDIITLADQLTTRLDSLSAKAFVPAVSDIREQMDGLLPREFPRSPGAGRLADTHRYLRAIGRRLDKLAEHPRRDRELMTRVQEVQAEYDRVVRSMADVERRAEARRVRWMIEELRVSHFAQSLGAAYPVSEKRILKTLASL